VEVGLFAFGAADAHLSYAPAVGAVCENHKWGFVEDLPVVSAPDTPVSLRLITNQHIVHWYWNTYRHPSIEPNQIFSNLPNPRNGRRCEAGTVGERDSNNSSVSLLSLPSHVVIAFFYLSLPQAWEALRSWYGGGPVVRRELRPVDMGGGRHTLALGLYPDPEAAERDAQEVGGPNLDESLKRALNLLDESEGVEGILAIAGCAPLAIGLYPDPEAVERDAQEVGGPKAWMSP
jgi:hypothetical protein